MVGEAFTVDSRTLQPPALHDRDDVIRVPEEARVEGLGRAAPSPTAFGGRGEGFGGGAAESGGEGGVEACILYIFVYEEK